MLLVPEGAVRLNDDRGAGARALRRRALARRDRRGALGALRRRRRHATTCASWSTAMAPAGAGGRCRRLGPTRSSPSCPIAARCTARTARTRSTSARDATATSSRRSTGSRVFREARALGVLQLALTGGEPMLRRDLDELVAAGARDAGLYSTLVTAGIALHARACRGAEGGRARPRPDLDPEPGPGGQRPHRRQPVVREEDRGGARRRASSTSR